MVLSHNHQYLCHSRSLASRHHKGIWIHPLVTPYIGLDRCNYSLHNQQHLKHQKAKTIKIWYQLLSFTSQLLGFLLVPVAMAYLVCMFLLYTQLDNHMCIRSLCPDIHLRYCTAGSDTHLCFHHSVLLCSQDHIHTPYHRTSSLCTDHVQCKS